MRALVVTWGPGGNLPPLLAAARLLVPRGHEVTMLASAETRAAAEWAGLPVVGWRRSPDPNVRVAFEDQAERMMATAAGAEIALDTRDVIDELRPDLVVADCMLPAALAAGEAAATASDLRTPPAWDAVTEIGLRHRSHPRCSRNSIARLGLAGKDR
jgi:UDP:flavonoid glycosyltransferase YjiC (YdhE family)